MMISDESYWARNWQHIKHSYSHLTIIYMKLYIKFIEIIHVINVKRTFKIVAMNHQKENSFTNEFQSNLPTLGFKMHVHKTKQNNLKSNI